MTIEIDASIAQLLETYPGIADMYEFQKHNGNNEFSIEHVVETDVDYSQGHGDNFEFSIIDIDGFNSKVWMVFKKDGLLEILYHAEEFSPDELRAINDACRIGLEDLNKNPKRA